LLLVPPSFITEKKQQTKKNGKSTTPKPAALLGWGNFVLRRNQALYSAAFAPESSLSFDAAFLRVESDGRRIVFLVRKKI